MKKVPVCEGDIVLEANNSLSCTTGWESQAYIVPFDFSQIDPQLAMYMFGVGFFLPLLPISAAFGVKKILSLIR